MSAQRTAGGHDVEALAELDREVFGRQAWSHSVWRQTLTAPHRRVLVSEDDRGLAGYAVAALAGGSGDLERIAVRPDRRGRRLADELLAAAEADWRRRGGLDALLEVRADNEAALRLYARHGWRCVDRRRGYYADGRVSCDALVLRLDLTEPAESLEVAR